MRLGGGDLGVPLFYEQSVILSCWKRISVRAGWNSEFPLSFFAWVEGVMKRVMKIVLSVLLGIFFIVAGGAKLMGSAAQVEHFAQWGYPFWFLYLTGIIEVGGGICLFFPKTQWYGIVVLSISMVGAALTHLRAGEMGAVPVPILLLGLLLILAWGIRKTPLKIGGDQ